MEILIIDNTIDRDCWGSEELRRLVRMKTGITLHVRRAPQHDLPENPAPYDGIIVSGSKTSILDQAPWINELEIFIRSAVEQGKPYLGVCYGHQILVRSLAGMDAVGKSSTPEIGWSQIQLIADSPLTQGLPRTFYTFSSHFEEVRKLPSGMKCLANSKDCQIQAYQLENQPIYGIQFHPEKLPADAERTLQRRKKEGTPKTLLNPTRGLELYNSRIGETIFKNFLEMC